MSVLTKPYIVSNKPIKGLWIYAVLLLMALLITLYFSFYGKGADVNIPRAIRGVVLSPPVVLHDFELIDHNRDIINLEHLKGKWTFVFFGFTNCPDVCPAMLSQLVLVNRKVINAGVASNIPGYLFVSVDPARDTPEYLKDYITYFDANFIGSTGTQSAIKSVEEQFGVFHRFGPKRADGGYNVTHSADAYLIDPAGRIVAKFSPPIKPDVVARQFFKIMKYYRQ